LQLPERDYEIERRGLGFGWREHDSGRRRDRGLERGDWRFIDD
jgi:hypothetical protein